MAHFAELDENNVVKRVIVVDDSDCLDENGDESEAVGIQFCQRIGKLGGNWKQTSVNTEDGIHILGGVPFRRDYAGIGAVYSESLDVFSIPRPMFIGEDYVEVPFNSWSLDSNFYWQPPTSKPDNGKEYWWDETVLAWVEIPNP